MTEALARETIQRHYVLLQVDIWTARSLKPSLLAFIHCTLPLHVSISNAVLALRFSRYVWDPFNAGTLIQHTAFVETPYVRHINYLTTTQALCAWFPMATASYVFVIYVNSRVPKGFRKHQAPPQTMSTGNSATINVI